MANERAYNPIGHAHLIPTGGLIVDHATAKFTPGVEFRDDRGNTFRYIQASEALVEGDVLTAVAEGVWDSGILVDGAGAAGDVKIHVDTITTAKDKNFYAGYYITQATAASKGKFYKIKAHEAFAASGEQDVFLEDPLSEVFANDAALRIFNPYLYEKTDADTEILKGVAINSITANYFGWVQIGGFFQAVKVGHSTSAAIVLNEPLVPIAANAGALQGMAGTTEPDIMEAAASGLIALRASAANTTGFVAASSKGIL